MFFKELVISVAAKENKEALMPDVVRIRQRPPRGTRSFLPSVTGPFGSIDFELVD